MTKAQMTKVARAKLLELDSLNEEAASPLAILAVTWHEAHMRLSGRGSRTAYCEFERRAAAESFLAVATIWHGGEREPAVRLFEAVTTALYRAEATPITPITQALTGRTTRLGRAVELAAWLGRRPPGAPLVRHHVEGDRLPMKTMSRAQRYGCPGFRPWAGGHPGDVLGTIEPCGACGLAKADH